MRPKLYDIGVFVHVHICSKCTVHCACVLEEGDVSRCPISAKEVAVTSHVTNDWDTCQMCTFIMSFFFVCVYMDTHTSSTSPSTPRLPLYEYSSNSGRWCQGFSFFFFSPSSRSSFPECFLGALELQWHCRSRVGVAETRCRSSLRDFTQPISAVSSQMICAHFELLEVVDFDAALMNTTGEFANANFFCLDIRSLAALGVSRTSFGRLSVPKSERFYLLGYESESSVLARPQRVT